jgi:hypothetical protein
VPSIQLSFSRVAVGCVFFCILAGSLCGFGLTPGLAFVLALLSMSLCFLVFCMIRKRSTVPAIIATTYAVCILLLGIGSHLIPDFVWYDINESRDAAGRRRLTREELQRAYDKNQQEWRSSFFRDLHWSIEHGFHDDRLDEPQGFIDERESKPTKN